MAEQDTLTLAFTISVDGQDAGTQEFEDEMVTIGKGAAAVLQINDPDLADLHAAVQLADDGSVTLLDLGSEGGTLLNGEKINNSPVADGDEIRLGKTVIKLGLIKPQAEEPEEDADGSAATQQDAAGSDPHDHTAEEEIAEAENVIDFILRSGTADSDLGIDRKAPPVLEVAEIWSGTVMNVRHYAKDVPAVWVGDRRERQIRVLSSIFTAILVFGVGFFALKHANLPEPPKFPEGDEALLEQWNQRDIAAKEKAAAERKAKREAEKKVIEDAADKRISENQRKYDREASTQLEDEKKEDPETTKTLADFVEKVRDDVISEVTSEMEEEAEIEREKNAPPNPYRDARDEWIAAKTKEFEALSKKANRPLLRPQYELYEQPNYEAMVIGQMLPLAKEAVKTGALKKSWQDEFDKWTKEYDVLDDLDVKRVAEDLVLGTRVLMDDKVITLVAGADPNKVYGIDEEGKEFDIENETELQLWEPSQEQVDARLAAFKDIQQVLFTQHKAKKSSRGQCDAVKELLEFDEFKPGFEYNARYSKCLADKSKFDASREYFERALENLPGAVADLSEDDANSYQTALTVKARTLLRDAYGGDPAKAGNDLLPLDKRERGMEAWQDLRGFILANTQQVNDLKQADFHINMLEKERLKEKQQQQVWNAMRLGLVILFLLPIGFGLDEIRSRKMAQDFFVSSENLPSDHWAIVEQDAAGVKVNFTTESVGFLESGGERTSTADLVSSGRAKDSGGYYQLELKDDERFVNDIGHMVFFIHRVHKAKVLAAPVGQNIDWLYFGILTALLFVGAGLGVRLLTMPYDPSQEVITIPDRFVELMVQDIEKEKDKKKPAGNPDAGEGAKAKDEEGKTGKKEAKLKKAKGSKVAIQKSELDKKIAESTGLLADLNNMTDTSIFGTGGLDNSVSNAVGGLIGSQYGNQMGAGGLGSRGSGYGGGGTAEGLGGLGTKGRGSGASGYGRGGGYYGQKGGGAPGVGAGDPIVLGALDKSIIDRIVKKHLPQIRYCYQKELNKNPKLFGKMVVKFVIAKDGSVSSSSTKTSTLKAPIVENCVHSRFMRMRFPSPKGGGIVIVSYPFVFNSQGG
ncbi:MAG: FHA domain-containing protein [Deltaproteobacteria bacterium]|nr:FHA domain-containing protein [Deltaproteobacteria bacterium]